MIDLVRQLAESENPVATPQWKQLKDCLPLIDAELQRADQLQKLHTEIALRAALLRAAHLCDRIDRGLTSVGEQVERLAAASPMAPPEIAGDDPWRGLVQWARQRHPDLDRRQEARLAELNIRNLNRRLAALNRDLGNIQKLGGEALDARLLAVLGMVGRFGQTVESIDRDALQRRLHLLARFIREGVLASETAVYTQIESQFPENAALAEEAIALLPAAANYELRLAAVLEAARRLALAQLHRHTGTGNFPDGMELRIRRNQESRLRSQLELLNRQTSAVLYAEPFLSGDALEATIDDAEAMRRTLVAIARLATHLARFGASRSR